MIRDQIDTDNLTDSDRHIRKITLSRRSEIIVKLPVLMATTLTKKGNKYILTLQDDLSKYVIGVPIH